MSKTTVPNGPTLAQFFDPAGHLMGLIEGSNPPESAPRTRVAAASSPRPPVQAQSGERALPSSLTTLRVRPKPPLKAKPKAKPRPRPKPKVVAKKRKTPAKAKKSAAKRGKGRSRR